jgi:hypothetical protein
LLHLAAKLSPPSQLARISGAALQMQRELQWYKVSFLHSTSLKKNEHCEIHIYSDKILQCKCESES